MAKFKRIEDPSKDPNIYDGLTNIPLSLGYRLKSLERGDEVRVVALGIRRDGDRDVPFARLRALGAGAPEYEVRAAMAPQTGQWVLIGYMGV